MFCVKGFADGKSAERYFGFAPLVIGAINTAVIDAAKQLAGSSGALQIFVTERLSKGGSTSGTARKPIANDWPQFPLWIKVPPTSLLLAGSFRRHIIRRLQNAKP
jgi:hypothetical protein